MSVRERATAGLLTSQDAGRYAWVPDPARSPAHP